MIQFITTRNQVSAILQKDSTAAIENLREELAAWQAEAARLQRNLPMEANFTNLKETEIPNIIQEQKKIEGALEDASTEAASLTERVEGAKSALKALQSLKQQAVTISNMLKRRDAASQYAQALEAELRTGNSVKSLDEIQAELSALQEKQYILNAFLINTHADPLLGVP
jgi:DNA repair protein RAD50